MIFKIYILLILFFLPFIWLSHISNSYIDDNEKISINLIGLNNYNNKDIYTVKQTIKEYFGFDCIIKNNIKTNYKGDIKPFCLRLSYIPTIVQKFKRN